jgi:hypothetical protein
MAKMQFKNHPFDCFVRDTNLLVVVKIVNIGLYF